MEKLDAIYHALQSPSSRRAWIEIVFLRERNRWREVALLAEGVDRNNFGASEGI